ncbi:hypothetical protein E2C01_080841 [Portunus trituberculatus]|uniref:RNA-directed DNA polymerase from mobile element jockey n=1 Tax=Portunus trituberculatus TaxID=210409 RepID=A0A5B7IV31_PORTR|nr:hypothetical protein [Portunus trituberculatus]
MRDVKVKRTIQEEAENVLCSESRGSYSAELETMMTIDYQWIVLQEPKSLQSSSDESSTPHKDSLPSPESHALYISARNHAKSVLQLAKHSFIYRKCQKLSNCNSPRDFWHLAKNISNNFTSSSFPPLFHLDGITAISSVSKAKLFSQTFANNSTLDDSGFVPPYPPSSDYFMPTVKVLRKDGFHALASLNPQKAYGPDGVLPIVLKNCGSVPAPCLAKLFQLCLSTSTFPS